MKSPSVISSTLLTLLLLYQGVVTNTQLIPAEYDFIIVGGGTAGCLLAARLSEVPHWNILLLEAGEEESLLHVIPLLAPISILSTSNWGYKAEKNQTFGLGLREGRLIWPRGRVLGGSSAINGMVYTRGNSKDFDHWEELGNKGWSFDKVLPYFEKFENMHIPNMATNSKHHSRYGELDVSFPPYHTTISTAFISAGLEEGYEHIDYSGINQIGFSYNPTTIKGGVRLSSYGAFLEPVKSRKNLKIMKNSLVSRILIDSTKKKAYGVEYRLFGLLPAQAHAKKEVIISGGSTNSPQLLMLSGIGPREHLDELGISVIEDLKVGYNLRDHVSLISLFFTVNDSVAIHLNQPVKAITNLFQYLMRREGEFTVPSGFEAMSFVDVGKQDCYPEIEMFFGGLLLPSIPFYLSRFGVLSDSFNKFFEPLSSLNGFTVLPILLRPYSVGRLKLRDRNPLSHPLVYPNYFSDHRDVEVLIKGIRQTVDLLKTSSLQKYGADLYRVPLPTCKQYEFETDAYWECALRYMTLSIQHSVGTCKMGPDSDPDAVVDHTLRVRGIKNLRVVDASIMPTITSGHTMSPVYMIAEKGADMIRSDWK